MKLFISFAIGALLVLTLSNFAIKSTSHSSQLDKRVDQYNQLVK